MRIGIDVSKAANPHDGIGIYTVELLRALLPLTERDELWFYSPHQPLDRAALETQLGALPERVRLCSGDPDADALDLYHATAWAQPIGFYGPVLFTCYDLTFLTHPECHTLNNKIHCLQGLLQARLDQAHFLTISDAALTEMEHHLEIPNERLHRVYPAAAERFRPLDAAAVRQRLKDSLDVEGNYILAVGTLEPRKNVQRLLQAYGALDPDLQKAFPLLLAGGDGWKNRAIHTAIEESAATVRYLGQVEDHTLVDLYNGATLFTYPSLAEGFGLPIVEAMACGTPVLTSNCGAMAEVAGPGACLADPEDVTALSAALANLLAKPEERRRLQELGRARAASFSWQRTAQEVYALYSRLV